jgi:hypothetical protein
MGALQVESTMGGDVLVLRRFDIFPFGRRLIFFLGRKRLEGRAYPLGAIFRFGDERRRAAAGDISNGLVISDRRLSKQSLLRFRHPSSPDLGEGKR